MLGLNKIIRKSTRTCSSLIFNLSSVLCLFRSRLSCFYTRLLPCTVQFFWICWLIFVFQGFYLLPNCFSFSSHNCQLFHNLSCTSSQWTVANVGTESLVSLRHCHDFLKGYKPLLFVMFSLTGLVCPQLVHWGWCHPDLFPKTWHQL